MLQLSRAWCAVGVSALLVLSGCAQVPRAAVAPDLWTGRLALRVESQQAQSFSAGFELKGNAQTGQLSLYSPLGGTIAQLAWAPGDARLRLDGRERQFDSLDALTKEATGTALPVASIFQWLAGANASTAGWQAELGELHNGRLLARRTAPPPVVEMRLVLDQ